MTRPRHRSSARSRRSRTPFDSRRTLLRATATATASALAVGGLAGCLGGFSDDTAEDSARHTATRGTTTASGTSDTSESRTTTTREAAVNLAPRSVQSSFFYLTTPDSMDVAGGEDEQFFFVTVAGTDDWPRPGAVELVADGERFRPTNTPGPVADSYRLYEQGEVYDPDDERTGWLAFEVPNPLDAESVALAYDDRRWKVAEQYRTALASPPAEFELVSFDTPEQVDPDEFFDVSFVVENVGEGDGTYRASLNESGPAYRPHTVELSVPAGEQAEWSRSFGSRLSESGDGASYRLRSAIADRDREVEVVSKTTSE